MVSGICFSIIGSEVREFEISRAYLGQYLSRERRWILLDDPIGTSAYSVFSEISYFILKIVDHSDRIEIGSRSNSLFGRSYLPPLIRPLSRVVVPVSWGCYVDVWPRPESLS